MTGNKLKEQQVRLLEQGAKENFRAYCCLTQKNYEFNWHHRVIADKLEAVERGEIKRLMVFMPPRHGKSELTTIKFPTWYLGRNPENPKSRESGLPTEQMLEPNLNGVSNTLTSVEKDNSVFDGKVRKLMPIECERLMSWEDNWTRWGIDDKGNKVEISDSQRYRQCGNGVCSNVVRAIVKELLM